MGSAFKQVRYLSYYYQDVIKIVEYPPHSMLPPVCSNIYIFIRVYVGRGIKLLLLPTSRSRCSTYFLHISSIEDDAADAFSNVVAIPDEPPWMDRTVVLLLTSEQTPRNNAAAVHVYIQYRIEGIKCQALTRFHEW